MISIEVGQKCWFVESTEKYPEQMLTEGVVVEFKPSYRGEGEYIIRVQRPHKVEWRSVSEGRIFGEADKKHAEEEARRLNVMGTVKKGIQGNHSTHKD